MLSRASFLQLLSWKVELKRIVSGIPLVSEGARSRIWTGCVHVVFCFAPLLQPCRAVSLGVRTSAKQNGTIYLKILVTRVKERPVSPQALADLTALRNKMT